MNRSSNNSDGFSIIELLLVVVVISGIGLISVWFYTNTHRASSSTNKKTTATNRSNTVQTVTVPNDAAATQVLGIIQSSLAERFKLLTGSQMPTKAGYLNVDLEKNSSSGPPLSVTGYNYYVAPIGSDLTVLFYSNNPSQSPNSSDVSAVQTILKQEFGTLQPATVYFDSQPYSGFQNNTAVCYYNADQTSSIDIECADKSAYPTTAATMKPLANAFIAANPTSYEHQFSNLKISQSKTPGYMIARMGTDASIGFFYEKDGIWHVYEDNQSSLSCDFTSSPPPGASNSDARAAFLGQPCSRGLGSPDSTVQ